VGLEPIEYDTRELEVAAEESMHSEAPTKQGGI